MDDALLRTDPAQLAVRNEIAPSLAPVCDEGGQSLATEAIGNLVNRSADNVVSAANGEGLRRGITISVHAGIEW